ncbi:hypothetical protein EV182_002871 [Spiromyces aspiralis]|uniref:Uncharacterized protein n=1 Tax=Spiromyces aspiralis TaxID=68401 RepID=A0ACC1HUM6_9FUNG|nr:hypothetical protein EV182_002871 [Spiromyces aspiralis]
MGECLGGALYIEDFKRLCERVGFVDPRQVGPLVPVRIESPNLRDLVGPTQFYSVTYRLFKHSKPSTTLEPTREDYGQVAIYRGTIEGQRARMRFDNDWVFEADRPTLIDGNTAVILNESWLKRHFEVRGDRSQHFGKFVHNKSATVQYEAWELEDTGIASYYPGNRVPEAFATANPNIAPPLIQPSLQSHASHAQSPSSLSSSSLLRQTAPYSHRLQLQQQYPGVARATGSAGDECAVVSREEGAALQPPPPGSQHSHYPPPPHSHHHHHHHYQHSKDGSGAVGGPGGTTLLPVTPRASLTENSSFPRLNSFSITQSRVWPTPKYPPTNPTSPNRPPISPQFTMSLNRVSPAHQPGLVPIAARPTPLRPSNNSGDNSGNSGGGSRALVCGGVDHQTNHQIAKRTSPVTPTTSSVLTTSHNKTHSPLAGNSKHSGEPTPPLLAPRADSSPRSDKGGSNAKSFAASMTILASNVVSHQESSIDSDPKQQQHQQQGDGQGTAATLSRSGSPPRSSATATVSVNKPIAFSISTKSCSPHVPEASSSSSSQPDVINPSDSASLLLNIAAHRREANV